MHLGSSMNQTGLPINITGTVGKLSPFAKTFKFAN